MGGPKKQVAREEGKELAKTTLPLRAQGTPSCDDRSAEGTQCGRARDHDGLHATFSGTWTDHHVTGYWVYS